MEKQKNKKTKKQKNKKTKKQKNKKTKKQTNKQIIIALAADLNYLEPITTLIKSVCYHHQYIKFYLINKEFPQEWFDLLNQKLNKINSEIINVRIMTDIFNNITIFDRITSPALYRYFVSELPDERILYLDCDIIIDGHILDFYLQDFKGNSLIAIMDELINLEGIPHFYKEFPNMKPYFNSGVLLINNILWKKKNIKDKLIQYTLDYKNFNFLDQDTLNVVLKDDWIAENRIYNYQIGMPHNPLTQGSYQELADFRKVEHPIIIHFTDRLKPWLNVMVEDKHYMKFREKYWFYHQLEWSEIITKHLE